MTNQLNHKVDVLRETLRDLERVVVAFSGGLDSTYLLKAAVDTLGPDNVVARPPYLKVISRVGA